MHNNNNSKRRFVYSWIHIKNRNESRQRQNIWWGISNFYFHKNKAFILLISSVLFNNTILCI
jgi:hypothetical protein